ncbi:hypothetical protein [Streptomyces yangpuensis]|uniref:hypothetical protein n=1 Tax=Streptomyces yangpuensis TaxID=1648182 RepID=UPI0036D153E0
MAYGMFGAGGRAASLLMCGAVAGFLAVALGAGMGDGRGWTPVRMLSEAGGTVSLWDEPAGTAPQMPAEQADRAPRESVTWGDRSRDRMDEPMVFPMNWSSCNCQSISSSSAAEREIA